MSENDLIRKITEFVEEICKSPSNFYTYTAWTHHIVLVVKNAKQLAAKISADEEIVEIAALLHDIASVTDKNLYEEHHIHGAAIAEKILSENQYPEKKIQLVKQCILNHRGSRPRNKLSNEELCVADGDTMAHFDSISSLFNLALTVHKLGIDEAESFVMNKLERSWKKLSPMARELVEERYNAAKILFGSD